MDVPKINLKNPDRLRFLSIGIFVVSLTYCYLAFNNSFEENYYRPELSSAFILGGLPLGLLIFIGSFFLKKTDNPSSSEAEKTKKPFRVTKDKNGKELPFPFDPLPNTASKVQPNIIKSGLIAIVVLAYLLLIVSSQEGRGGIATFFFFIVIPSLAAWRYFSFKKYPSPTSANKVISTYEGDVELNAAEFSFYGALASHMSLVQRTGTIDELCLEAQRLPASQRTSLIDKIFENNNRIIKIHCYTVLYNTRSDFSFTIMRDLALMLALDRACLQAAFHLYNNKLITDKNYQYYVATILAAGNRGSIEKYREKITWFFESTSQHMPLDQLKTVEVRSYWLIENSLGWRYQEVNSHVVQRVEELLNENPDDPIIKEVYEIMHHGSGWLSSLDINGSLLYDPSRNPKYKLRLGLLDDGTPLEFTNDGSLMTIGGAGTGKTQSLVIPNLLNWAGSSIVLDIKSELYKKTAGYRAQNFGKVYTLNFSDKKMVSDRFNPFDYLSEDPQKLYSDSDFISNLIAPPYAKGGNDEFWEGGGRIVLQACLIGLVTERVQAKLDKKHDPTTIVPRISIGEILKLMTKPDQFKQMIYQMGTSPEAQTRLLADGIRSHFIEGGDKTAHYLTTHFITMNLKMRELFDPKLEDLTSASDWQPLDLRREYATLYIMLDAGGISQFSTMLRLILGIHIREYLKLDEDEAKAYPPILLMLDEMAQLGYMEIIEGAIDKGRDKGIVLWGFLQRLGQLKKHYEEAEGFLGNCRINTYLSPSTEDGLAQMVSNRLGTRSDLATGQPRPLAEPAELAGARYRDKIIVTGLGAQPARPNKDMAFLNPELQQRMNIPPPK